ncbi:MAG: PASTA domain-containing protein, partial [Thermomicrobiaceae bacterium]
ILAGLIGLVVLAFQMGDFGLFEPSSGDTSNATPSPSPTVDVSPTPSPTPEVTSTPEPTPEETATPEPSPTPEEELVVVPEFIGATLEQAERAAGDLQLQVEEVFSDEFDQGIIVSQDPAPGEDVSPDATVIVRVSQGRETFNIPNLQGSSRSAALNELNNIPVGVEEIQEPSQSVPEGQVLRVEPTGRVNRGSTVTLYVSMGDVVQVPNVFETPVESAIDTLQSAGLQVGSASAQDCDYIQAQNPNFNCSQFPDGHIVSGTLQWGAWVNRGQVIDIAYFDEGDEGDDGNQDDDDNDDDDNGDDD